MEAAMQHLELVEECAAAVFEARMGSIAWTVEHMPSGDKVETALLTHRDTNGLLLLTKLAEVRHHAEKTKIEIERVRQHFRENDHEPLRRSVPAPSPLPDDFDPSDPGILD